jgi:hypothetical protein
MPPKGPTVTAQPHSVTEQTVNDIVTQRAGEIREHAGNETRRRITNELDRAGYPDAAAYLRRTR